MQLTKQEQQAIFDAKAGASVNIAQLTMDAPVIPLKMTAGGPPLLLSDDPEYIRLPQAGAMRETLRPGIFRLYSYHVNAIKGQQTRITNVIENLGDKPMTVRLLRQAFPKPDNEYNLVGCEGLKQYWTSTPEEQGRIVAPGQSIAIDPKMENTLISYDDLSHGFYEIFIDQPARITTLQTTSDKSGPDANKQIHELQPIPAENNNAGRGFFPFSEYEVTTPDAYVMDTANGAVQIVIADGITDRWITGWSSDLDKPTILAGNYGVMYNMTIQRKHSDGRAWALITWNLPKWSKRPPATI